MNPCRHKTMQLGQRDSTQELWSGRNPLQYRMPDARAVGIPVIGVTTDPGAGQAGVADQLAG